MHRRPTQLDPQRAEHVVDEATGAGFEEQEVAGPGAHRVDQADLLRLGEELHHRRVERASLADPHPDQARRAQLLGPIDQAIDLGARHRSLTGQPDALDHRRLERPELGGREHFAQVDQLEPEAHVGLVGAEAVLGLLPGHAPPGPVGPR